MPEARLRRARSGRCTRSASELAGVPCVPSLDALPGVPDAVFLGVNRHATVEAMATLRSIGAGGAVCYGSGFAETGDADLQRRPARCGRRSAVPRAQLLRLRQHLRPRRAVARRARHAPRCERGVAHRVAERQRRRQPHVPTARSAPRHDRLRRQPGQRRHGGLHRGVPRRPADHRDRAVPRGGSRRAALRRRCRHGHTPRACRSSRCRPGGRAAGAAIATSHTGSMSGRAAAYDALFARYGVATVTTPAEMLETLKLLDNGGRLSGPRIVSMSCSGGEASLVADRTEHGPLRFEPFADRPPASDRVDADRAGHGQQPVRLPHVHVGRSGRDVEDASRQ